jgi:hypothetical protein
MAQIQFSARLLPQVAAAVEDQQRRPLVSQVVLAGAGLEQVEVRGTPQTQLLRRETTEDRDRAMHQIMVLVVEGAQALLVEMELPLPPATVETGQHRLFQAHP